MSYKFNPLLGVGLDDVGSGGAAATPGGSDTQVQFNDGGSFGGSADLTWDDTGKVLGVGGDIDLDDGGTYATTLQVITPTANRTISYPDATGTLALVAGSSGQLIYNNAGANAGLSTAAIGATGDITLSLNGAASTPPLKLTGTWFTGGTATTTKPQVLIEPAGTTGTWSTSGTGLGVNAASGFAGNLLDLQVDGTSYAFVNSGGIGHFGSGIDNAVRAGFSSNPPGGPNGMGLWTTGGGRLWLKGYANVYLGDAGTIGLFGGNFGFSATAQGTIDTILARDAADTLAQRRGTNAQTYRLYNSYTDASNYQRTSITDDSTGLVIDQQYAGTGAARTNLLDLKLNGTSKVSISGQGTPVLSASGGLTITPAGPLLGIGASNTISWYFTSKAFAAASNNSTIIFGSTSDVGLERASAGLLLLTNGSTGTGYLKQTPVAVSALPNAATVGAGTRGFVSDSTVAASGNFGATVTGGGSNNVPVFSDGTNWLIG